MVGASDTGGSGLSVSSWGWADFDGDSPVLRDVAHFRKWSVRDKDDVRIAMLLLPVDQGAMDALSVAYRAFADL